MRVVQFAKTIISNLKSILSDNRLLQVSNIFRVLLSGKLIVLILNLATGSLLARGTETSERGLIFGIASALTIIQVLEAMSVNERNLMNRRTGSVELNPLTMLIASCFFVSFLILVVNNINLVEVILLVLSLNLSLYNSRLFNLVIINHGVVKNRIIQVFSTMVFTLLIVLCFVFQAISLSNWIVINFVNEIMAFLLAAVIGELPSKSLIPSLKENSFDFISLEQITSPIENLSDRLVIGFGMLLVDPAFMAFLALSISLINLVSTPFVASYPYPVSHASTIIRSLFRHKILFAVFFTLAIIALVISSSVFLKLAIPFLFGSRYEALASLSLVITICGASLGTQKFVFFMMRGLGKFRPQFLLQLVGIFAILIAVYLSKSSTLYLFEIFFLWSLMNIISSCAGMYWLWQKKS